MSVSDAGEEHFGAGVNPNEFIDVSTERRTTSPQEGPKQRLSIRENDEDGRAS